ncbi:MAG TPA: hypothetical protein PK264_04585 [Hyphomicrobiaceae bacterium]|nr:hypothetical protein [Hyphomicrobiaceae bacterium]
MTDIVIWMLAIAVSVAALVVAAAAKLHYIHMAVAAVMAIFIALSAVRELRVTTASGAGDAAVASVAARYMGLVWAWGAIVLMITYMFILQWKEWWQFFIAFIVAAGICLFFSATLRSDSAKGADDPGMLSLSRYLALAQAIGTVVTIVGLGVFDGKGFRLGGKMLRFLDPRHTDWAANNVFFFGAIALAAISFTALSALGRSRR